MILKLSHLSALVLGFMVSCTESKNKNVTTNDKDAQTYDICTLKEDDETKALKICTPEFLNEGTADGQSCYYTKCQIKSPNNDCPTYFVKSKASSVPNQQYCSYNRPVEL
jgi:hypothetical protein